MRRLLWAFSLLAAAGCNFDAALDTYCDQSGRCEADGGAFCAQAEQRCSADVPCCDGLQCSEAGFCTTGTRAALALEPPAVDFGQVEPGARVEKTVWLRNAGTAPAPTVAFALRDTRAFQLDASGCGAEPLGPGERCEVKVAFFPGAVGRWTTVLAGKVEGYDVTLGTQLQGRSGVELSVERVGSAGVIESDPAGLSCGGSCVAWFREGSRVTLHARAPAGSSFVRWSGGCAGTSETCEVTASADTPPVFAEFRPWLSLEVVTRSGAYGEVSVRSASQPYGWTTCTRDCSLAVGGTITVQVGYAPHTGNATLERWEGACVPAGSSLTCTLEVTGPTQVRAVLTPPNRAFVTWTPADPSTFGPDGAGADRECMREAQRRGFPINTYRAWLSSSTRSAVVALGTARGWLDDGGWMVARTREELLAGGPLNLAVTQSSALMATGTSAQGAPEPDPAATCADWTRPDGTHRAGTYDGGDADGTWTRDLALSPARCDWPVHLYCFGTDYQAILP